MSRGSPKIGLVTESRQALQVLCPDVKYKTQIKKRRDVMFVYVLDKNNRPLMPTQRFGKVRRMLRDGRAKVVRREPFTIKLLYEPKTKIVQEVTLGVDTGSDKIGAVAITNNTVVYASEVQIRNDISKKMERRRIARRNRRNRKTRYRKPRYLNRGNSIKKDRFSPTMASKINSHKREIAFINSILPISIKVLETGTFDPHLLKMQEDGKPFNKSWGYQKGQNYGVGNAKAACLNRDNYTCQCCKTKKGTLHAHHVIYRSKGGADVLDNLITLCEQCHKKLHEGKLKDFEKKLKGKRKGTLKHATQMNSIRKQLLKYYPEAVETFGFVTKENRQLLNLPKSHIIDACVITSQGKRFDWNLWYFKKKHVSKGNYQQTKYWSKSKNGINYRKLTTGKIMGFRKYDKVEYLGQEYFIKSRSKTSPFRLINVDGDEVTFEKISPYKYARTKKLIRITARNSTLCIKQKNTSIHVPV